MNAKSVYHPQASVAHGNYTYTYTIQDNQNVSPQLGPFKPSEFLPSSQSMHGQMHHGSSNQNPISSTE